MTVEGQGAHLVPFNPCGAAVDFGRTGYSAPCNFSSDPNFPPTRQVWYFTDQDFLPFPTVFGSRIWDSEHVGPLTLGEVDVDTRDPPFRKVVNGLPGDHVCGTPEMFMRGVPPGYTSPIIIYDAAGIPTCCNRLPQEAGVGIATAGSNVIANRFPQGASTVHATAGSNVLLNCSSYSFVCSGETIVLNNTIPDAQWQGVSSLGITWLLGNTRGLPLTPPGAWRLLSSPAFGTYLQGTGWNGRGATTFVRQGLLSSCTGNPPAITVTGSCT